MYLCYLPHSHSHTFCECCYYCLSFINTSVADVNNSNNEELFYLVWEEAEQTNTHSPWWIDKPSWDDFVSEESLWKAFNTYMTRVHGRKEVGIKVSRN